MTSTNFFVSCLRYYFILPFHFAKVYVHHYISFVFLLNTYNIYIYIYTYIYICIYIYIYKFKMYLIYIYIAINIFSDFFINIP